MCHRHHALQIEHRAPLQLLPTSATISPTMAPIRPSKSSSSFLQPPKGTRHKQHVRRCNESSDPEDGETTSKVSAKRKCKHDPLLSADESMDRPSTTKKMKKNWKKQKKKKSTMMTDTVDEGDETHEGEDEATPRDEAPADMDENDQALSMSLTSL